MTIVQVTTHEGGEWHNMDWGWVQCLCNDPSQPYAAVRFGDNIYDFVLARLGINPWRRMNDPQRNC